MVFGFFLMKSRDIDDSVLKFLGELVNKNKPPTILFSLESGIVNWCLKNKIRFQQRVPEGGGRGAAVERYLICDILGSTRSKYKVWRRSWPRRFKHLRGTEKAKSTDFKNFLYESAFYQTISLAVVLEKVIIALNKSVSEGSVEPYSISQGPLGPQAQGKAVLKGAALNAYFDKLFNETSPANRPLLKAIRDTFIAQTQVQLSQLGELKDLKSKQAESVERMEELLIYKREHEAAKAAKAARRAKRLARERRHQTQPFREEYLNWLLNFIKNNEKYNYVTKLRLRCVVLLLFMTGARVSEIRKLKVSKIITLLKKHYLEVNLSKRGHRAHKFFIQKDGRDLIKRYRTDFLNLLNYSGFLKKDAPATNFSNIDSEATDLFFFSKGGGSPLSRSFFTRHINAALQKTPELVERGLFLTSHSFRYGMITTLWNKTRDIELVSQIMGHSSPNGSSGYVQKLSEEDRKALLHNI